MPLAEHFNMGGGNGISHGYFSFIRDPSDGVQRLFKIFLPTLERAMPDVIDALTDKFGPPTSTRGDTVQNRMGATFAQKTYNWSNGVSSIFVQGPIAEVDKMVVVYTLDSLQSNVDALVDAKKRATKNRM